MIAAIKQGQNILSVADSSPADAVEGLAVKLNATLSLNAGQTVVTGILASLVSAFPENPKFEPEIEGENTPISIVPDEILVMILRKLDPMSVERFARVDRKARILSLDPVIWRYISQYLLTSADHERNGDRELVTKTYKPPQVVDMEAMHPVVANYMSDFRRVYIEHPRVRLDGVYIATCHYMYEYVYPPPFHLSDSQTVARA